LPDFRILGDGGAMRCSWHRAALLHEFVELAGRAFFGAR
jgi:hypothetical protein